MFETWYFCQLDAINETKLNSSKIDKNVQLKALAMNLATFSWSYVFFFWRAPFPNTDNTHLLHKAKNHWTADLLFQPNK